MKFAMQAAPTPYEYALLSTAIYSNQLHEKGETYDHAMPAEQLPLANKGWNLMKFISLENAYIGAVWVNDKSKQVVIVHRGSKNATSWITDVESVVKLKSGEFITSALDMMKDPMILEYRQKEYRLSTTGHSLGGFLAQICVYWAHRIEQKETYYPEMSAMVFDSPGAADFMESIQSNLVSEKERITIPHLKIHNFCAMPTVVSTFGTQTGTVWHLSAPTGVRFAFVNDHRMTNILPGFDEQTGQPKNFRRMIDWPQADYSAYSSLTSAIEHIAGETVKAPFQFLNWLYKGTKTKFGFNGQQNTWFDQLFKSKSEVNFYLEETKKDNYRPTLEQLEDDINLALKGHYATLPSEEMSMQRIDIHHFDYEIQLFLLDVIEAQESDMGKLGWDDLLRETYGKDEYYPLLNQFTIKKQGNKIEVILLTPEAGNIFDFQQYLMVILGRCSLPISLQAFMATKVEELDNNVVMLKTELEDINIKESSKNFQQKQAQIAVHEEELRTLKAKLLELEKAYWNKEFGTKILAALPSDLSSEQDKRLEVLAVGIKGDAIVDGKFSIEKAIESYGADIEGDYTAAEINTFQDKLSNYKKIEAAGVQRGAHIGLDADVKISGITATGLRHRKGSAHVEKATDASPFDASTVTKNPMLYQKEIAPLTDQRELIVLGDFGWYTPTSTLCRIELNLAEIPSDKEASVQTLMKKYTKNCKKGDIEENENGEVSTLNLSRQHAEKLIEKLCSLLAIENPLKMVNKKIPSMATHNEEDSSPLTCYNGDGQSSMCTEQIQQNSHDEVSSNVHEKTKIGRKLLSMEDAELSDALDAAPHQFLSLDEEATAKLLSTSSALSKYESPFWLLSLKSVYDMIPVLWPANGHAFKPRHVHKTRLPLSSFNELAPNKKSIAYGNLSCFKELETKLNNAIPITYDLVPDTHPSIHSVTGAPIFRYFAYEGKDERGHIDFYQHPLLCVSSDRTRHNVFSATGIFAEVVKQIIPEHVLETCEAVPPTAWEEIMLIASRSGIEGAKYGVMRGISRVVTTQSIENGYSVDMAQVLGKIFFYVCFYFYQVSQQLAGSNRGVDGMVLLRAAIITGQMAVMELMVTGLVGFCRQSSDYLAKQGSTRGSAFVTRAGQTVTAGLYGYQMYQQGALAMAAGTAAGVAAEQGVVHIVGAAKRVGQFRNGR